MPSQEYDPKNTSQSESAPESDRTPHVQAQKNVEAIMRLEQEAIHRRSPAEKIADRITTAAGSTPFVILHIFWFGGWVAANTGLIPGVTPFDRFPFSFLTLVVSLEAIFLTLLVLMSQNRMTKEADKRAHLDLQLNMLAEQEATVVLRLVKRIGKHLGLEDVEEGQQLAEETDVHQIAKTLDEKSPN